MVYKRIEGAVTWSDGRDQRDRRADRTGVCNLQGSDDGDHTRIPDIGGESLARTHRRREEDAAVRIDDEARDHVGGSVGSCLINRLFYQARIIHMEFTDMSMSAIIFRKIYNSFGFCSPTGHFSNCEFTFFHFSLRVGSDLISCRIFFSYLGCKE